MKKIMLRRALCLPVLIFAFAATAHAQALSSEDVKAQLVKEWTRAKSYTVTYLNTMPADKYSFKATDSVRSFAQQMIHLAQANYFLMSTATGDKPASWASADLEHSPGAQKKDSVMYYVTASYDFCINAVKNSDVNKWGTPVKIFGQETTQFGMMIKTFEHQTHHRGQSTVYIRLVGVKPPQEQLF